MMNIGTIINRIVYVEGQLYKPDLYDQKQKIVLTIEDVVLHDGACLSRWIMVRDSYGGRRLYTEDFDPSQREDIYKQYAVAGDKIMGLGLISDLLIVATGFKGLCEEVVDNSTDNGVIRAANIAKYVFFDQPQKAVSAHLKGTGKEERVRIEFDNGAGFNLDVNSLFQVRGNGRDYHGNLMFQAFIAFGYAIGLTDEQWISKTEV